MNVTDISIHILLKIWDRGTIKIFFIILHLSNVSYFLYLSVLHPSIVVYFLYLPVLFSYFNLLD